MKILPLAKIAAARKRLIERPKEMKMPKIDVEALIAQVDDIAPATWNEFSIEFSRLIIEECAKRMDEGRQHYEKLGEHQRADTLDNAAHVLREMKP